MSRLDALQRESSSSHEQAAGRVPDVPVPGRGLELVLLRHGESTWNEEGRFTGWVDVDLSERGALEALHAGELLAARDLLPDVVHTSVLIRSIRTAELALGYAQRSWIPVRRSWRLNERHYGALQGKNKEETRFEFGDDQYMLWRRSYDVPPPPLSPDSELAAGRDPRYRSLPADALPATECLKDVLVRVLPYWYDAIVPDLRAGRRVLVVAHGNSLRALVKHLDGISDDAIVDLNLPTGVPLLYELDEGARPRRKVDPRFGVSGAYLDASAAATSIDRVRTQGQVDPRKP
jgi:2,3-bisphosphoglycerate-dependent phosphoglycerate mutase